MISINLGIRNTFTYRDWLPKQENGLLFHELLNFAGIIRFIVNIVSKYTYSHLHLKGDSSSIISMDLIFVTDLADTQQSLKNNLLSRK